MKLAVASLRVVGGPVVHGRAVQSVRCVATIRNGQTWSEPSKKYTSPSAGFHSSRALQKRDFYDVLGLSRGASKADIKKKYFELAKKYHPDVNKEKDAQEKFREVTEAYEVLEDDKKRELYDNYGHAGVDPNSDFGSAGAGFGGAGFGPFGFHGFGGQQVHMDQEEIMDLFEGMFGGGRVNRGRGRDVQQAITIDFLEAVNGCTKEINVEYNDKKSNNQRMKKKKTVRVTIPAGVDDGVALRVQNEGGEGLKGHPNGDLLLQIRVKKDNYFMREGSNVHVEIPISITQAILGAKVDVLTLEGMVEVTVPPGTQPESKLILRNKGIKQVNSIFRGDQYVHLKVKIPKDITEKQKELLQQFEAAADDSKQQTSKEKQHQFNLNEAWERVKEFLGKKDSNKEQKDSNKK